MNFEACISLEFNYFNWSESERDSIKITCPNCVKLTIFIVRMILHAMSTACVFAENYSHYSFGLTACGMAIISYELKLPPLGCFASVELILS